MEYLILIFVCYVVGIFLGYKMGSSIKNSEWENYSNISFFTNSDPIIRVKRDSGDYIVRIYDKSKVKIINNE